MNTLSGGTMVGGDSEIAQTKYPVEEAKSGLKVWLMALFAGLLFAWPLLFAVLLHGPKILLRCFVGDSYHYLAIARKANVSHIYTYDGVHVTNGFHPLWQYTIRGMFWLLNLQSHESQAIAVMMLALGATTVGVTLGSAAVIRLTNKYFLGLLLIPGLYYLVVGVQVKNLWVWSSLDGMESAFSVLFGGVFFYLMSHSIGVGANGLFDSIHCSRVLGLVLPFLVLSRLDDVFILPAFLIAIALFEPSARKRVIAAIWIAAPSTMAVFCYLVYNKLTVGAAMPLSGSTKSGFVGFVSAYLTAAIHFPPVLDLKSFLTKIPADGSQVFANSFRFVEVFYPLIAAGFGAVAIWKYRRTKPGYLVFFAVCLYVIFKMSYNFLNVHPWHQAGWYYAFAMLSLSVLGATALQKPWTSLNALPLAKTAILTVYALLMMLSASQYYASIVYQSPETPASKFWERRDETRKELLAHGVSGLINVDDGITAFLLDLPSMHGFAFATDVEAQRAYKSGSMLSLAYSRGINTITGFEYLSTDNPPQSEDEIRQYLSKGLASAIVRPQVDDFVFSLAYYDPVLKMPFISFKPKPR